MGMTLMDNVTQGSQNVFMEQLNEDIKRFPQVHPITKDMHRVLSGVSRLVMLDRYAFKDIEKATLKQNDFVVLTVKEDPKFPARGYGTIVGFDRMSNTAKVRVDDSFLSVLEDPQEAESGIIQVSLDVVEKPLEIYHEQIAKRVATGLASVETNEEHREKAFQDFYYELVNMNFIPAGRVLYGAGAGTDVTYFNCYVMPYPRDSRGGIAEHRKKVMEIMSRGGGVGTNGSTLRPRGALCKGVNGKSSGSVSWLDDIAKLTHLVEQGGSRRGAQMIMLSSWHPDIIEFIISKMQNPRVLRFIIDKAEDPKIRKLAKEKLKFTPLSPTEVAMYEGIMNLHRELKDTPFKPEVLKEAEQKLEDRGTYSVHNTEFLTGANISVCLTDDFMEAVENDASYDLRFPDVENYNEEEKRIYNEEWGESGDVREWEARGFKTRVYQTIQAKELWKLINICATYSAEPGIFFIDNANKMTNATAYGQKVVATNPCGEQPLAPYSVCNLAAVNLAEMVDKDQKAFDFDKLKQTVKVGVRMQDNVIDATPYFLEDNTHQAKGERRVGLGVMGLHDALIYEEKAYGSDEGNELVDQIFETIAVAAYEASVEIAKEKGSFPFLIGQTDEETQKLRHNFIHTGYMKKMPESIRGDILKYGIRNSHLLTVAPTGSTGTMVGVSTGLEPYFSFSYYRSGRLGKFMEVKADIVQEYLDRNPEADPENLPDWFVSAMELAPEQHADTQCIIQKWVDSSLSKTVNAPKGYTVQQVQGVYERLHRGGAKGGTVYVDGSRDAQVLSLTTEDQEQDQKESLFEDWEVDVKPKQYVLETIPALNATNVTYGAEVGETCPICRAGTVEDIGGCNTCDSCQAQLKCGL